MEKQSIKSILESNAYVIQKAIIAKEINVPQHVVDRKTFSKSEGEKNILYALKMKFREPFKALGISKRRIPKTYRQPSL